MKRGVTLVELMVAIIISGIVIFITLEMLRGESQNYSQIRSRIKLQTEAREAVRIIEEELNNAGFRFGANISFGLMTTTDCNDGYSSINSATTKAFFKPLPNGIEYHSYNPFPNHSFTCEDDLQWIRYSWNPEDSILYRKWAKGKIGSVDMNSIDSVPFLEHISNFQIEYGIFRENTFYVTPTISSTPTNSLSGGLSITRTEATSISSAPWAVTGWSTGLQHALLNVSIPPLERNATYRISFNASANDAFRDALSGIDTSSLRAGLFNGNGSPTAYVFKFYPSRSSGGATARKVQCDIAIGSQDLEKYVFFGFQGKLKSTPGADVPQLDLSNITVKKLNSGRIKPENWVTYTSASSTLDWGTIAAARISLSVHGKGNTTQNYQRTILLLNNETKD